MVENLNEVDDPKEINVRYENVKPGQTSQSNQHDDTSRRIEPIRIRLPVDSTMNAELIQSQATKELIETSRSDRSNQSDLLNQTDQSSPTDRSDIAIISNWSYQSGQSNQSSRQIGSNEASQSDRTNQSSQSNPPNHSNRPYRSIRLDWPGQPADTGYTIFAKGKDTNITSLNKVKVQSELTRIVGRRIQISQAGQSLRINCISEAERRAVRSQSTIVGYEVQYSEPYSKVKENDNKVKGIIFGVDADITDEELCEETGAQSAKRIIKRYDGKYIKTAQVLLVFESELPPYVSVGYKRHRVSNYIPDPIRCLRCQRWGHKANSCNGKEKCAICSKQHNARECPEKEKENEQRELKCTNCGGKHAASYQGCAKFKIAKEVTKIQFNSGTRMTYAEAIKKRRSEIEQNENNNQIKTIDGNQPPESNKSSLPSSKSVIKINVISDNVQTQRVSVEPKAQSPSNEPQGGGSNEIALKSNENLKMKSQLKQKATVSSKDQSAFSCHTECVGKTVFLRFLKDCEYLSIQNRNSSNILDDILQIISNLAKEIGLTNQ